MKYEVVPRELSLDGFERQVLVGVRRAGKSYLLYGHIQKMVKDGCGWDEIVYLNFEDERLAGMQLEELNSILEVHGRISDKRPALFFDEIQNVDGWEKFARRLADQKYKMFITGSNAKMLSKDVAAVLGGRFITKEVFPLSFEEYLRIRGLDPSDIFLMSTTSSRSRVMRLFEDYFQFGGFPECAGFPVKRDYLNSLYQKIFLGDIAARHRIDNIFALRVLFRKLAESIKQPLSFTRAAHIVASTGTKIGKSTIINYLDYAKDACLIYSINNICDSLTEKVSNPKYYFIDNGIISILALDVRTSLLENMVALHLLRHFGSEDSVFFYNDKIEVDFYIPDIEMALQVCYSLKENKDTFDRETKALCKIGNHLNCSHKLIVTYDEEDSLEIDENIIEVVPVWKFLRMPLSKK